MEDQVRILTARRLYYCLLADLFTFSENERFLNVAKMLEILRNSPLDETSAEAIDSLISKFTPQNLQNIIQEYDDIFHAPPHAIRNTFSYYDEGFESGHACARVRELLKKTDIRRDERNFKENEDSVGFTFLLMAEFLTRQIAGDERYGEFADELFSTTIHPFIDKFISELYACPAALVYKDACAILQAFIEFERLYYELAKPNYDDEKHIKTQNGISRSEALRREQNRAKRNAERKINAQN